MLYFVKRFGGKLWSFYIFWLSFVIWHSLWKEWLYVKWVILSWFSTIFCHDKSSSSVLHCFFLQTSFNLFSVLNFIFILHFIFTHKCATNKYKFVQFLQSKSSFHCLRSFKVFCFCSTYHSTVRTFSHSTLPSLSFALIFLLFPNFSMAILYVIDEANWTFAVVASKLHRY